MCRDCSVENGRRRSPIRTQPASSDQPEERTMATLENKVAIVTGASSGIGHATAKLFAREGARVVVGARRRAELERLVAEIAAAGGQAACVAGDVRDETFAAELVATAEREFGGLDVAFNNAGTLGEMGP